MSDRDEIERAVLDYFEGWFDGDAGRMERALHADLVKRSSELKQVSAAQMVEATAQGVGKSLDVPDRGIEIDVHDIHGEIANVTVRSAVYREYVQLARTRDGWKIVNTLWQRT
jgi:hypothetical protein